MAKRKNQSDAQVFIGYLVILLSIIISMIIKLIMIGYDFITIYSSGYKNKSGNGFFKTYFNKGIYGEFKLFKKSVKIFGRNNVYTNLYLENEKTDYTEIDVVALSPKGIYVFEMKNYGGYIFGTRTDETWMQVFHRNSKKSFYNPLRQNYAHTKAIEKYLNQDSEKIVPVVVFGNRANLDRLNMEVGKEVIKLKGLKSFIKKREKRSQIIYNSNQLNDFSKSLINNSNMSEEVKQRHIEQVNEISNLKGSIKE